MGHAPSIANSVMYFDVKYGGTCPHNSIPWEANHVTNGNGHETYGHGNDCTKSKIPIDPTRFPDLTTAGGWSGSHYCDAGAQAVPAPSSEGQTGLRDGVEFLYGQQ
jgi:hypothetical protein